MTSKQRAYLKGLASAMEPIVHIGKSGAAPEATAAVEEAFNNRELIKISVLKNCPEEPLAVAEMLAERTHSQVVQVIGRKAALYRPDRKKPKILLPE